MCVWEKRGKDLFDFSKVVDEQVLLEERLTLELLVIVVVVGQLAVELL